MAVDYKVGSSSLPLGVREIGVLVSFWTPDPKKLVQPQNLPPIKMAEREYTVIPKEFEENYEDWFSLETIQQHYDGNVMKACESHPVFFAYYFLGIKLRVYQIYMIEHMLKFNFIFSLWSRRLGKSITFKVFTAWALFYNKYPQGSNKTTKIIAISHTSEASDDYITDIKEMFEIGDEIVYKRFNGKLGKKYLTSTFPTRGKTGKNNQKQLSIYNKGWNTLKSFPPTTAARGKPASIMVLDEIAFWKDYTSLQKDDYTIYGEVVRPIITDPSSSAKIFAATTPNGDSGLAYDLLPIDGHQTRYNLLWFPYYIHKDQSYLDEMYETEKEYQASGKMNSFRQEYLAELVSKNDAYFDRDTEIENVFSENYQMVTQSIIPVHVGLDFGGSVKSRTVITMSMYDEESKICRRVYSYIYPLREDSTLKEDIIEWNYRFNIKKFHIDDQGGGSSLYAWFRNKFGEEKVDEVSFRREKADMYRLFKIACFQDRIKSFYDPNLFDEMVSFTADLKPPQNKTDDSLDSFVMSVKDWIQEDDGTERIGVLMI